MNAQSLQHQIVYNISTFLARAEMAMEILPSKQKPGTRYMTMQFLRDQLLREVGPQARWRMVGADAIVTDPCEVNVESEVGGPSA